MVAALSQNAVFKLQMALKWLMLRGTYDFFKRNSRANSYLESPEIVVEILSPSNTRQEMAEKKELYFARGAKEFWMCDHNGEMSFFSNHAELLKSQLIAEFPTHIVIDFA